MPQYKPMLIFFDEEGYQIDLQKAKRKVQLFSTALGVASTHIAVENTKAFAEDFAGYLKREFYKLHKEKIQLPVSPDKLLDLLDVNLAPLQKLQDEFNSINAELRWEGNKPVAYLDRKPYEKWTTSAEENQKLRDGKKFLEALEKLSEHTQIYPANIQRGTSNLIFFDMRKNRYIVNV